MRNIMMLAMVCWNLPIMESRTDVDGRSTRMFDDAMARMPDALGRVLVELIEVRKTRFAMVPFYVTVQVKGTSLENARAAVLRSRHRRARAARQRYPRAQIPRKSPNEGNLLKSLASPGRFAPV